jgi:hypothetical protein
VGPNLTRLIYEERGAARLLVPAKFAMTGALAAAEAEPPEGPGAARRQREDR